jgi:hypothetical protein
MPSSIWLPDHAAQLKRLRLAAGMDSILLAKRHLISPNQLKQLEEGGDSAFYSPAIKFNIGRKLVLSLGEDLTQSQPTAAADDSPDPDPSLTTTPSGVSPLRTQPFLEEVQSSSVASATPSLTLNDAPTRSSRWIRMAVMSSMVLGAVAFFVPRQSAPPTVDTPQESHENVAAQRTEAAQDQSTTTQSDAPVQPQAVAVAAADAVVPTPAPDAEGCVWSSESIDLSPSQGSHPPNFFYLVALKASTICWRDAQRTTAKIQLRENEAITLAGQPPFSISSSSAESFKLYFRGQLIRMHQSGAIHVVLRAP